MTQREVVVAAVAAVVGAVLGEPWPPSIIVASLVAAAVWRHPALVAVALAVVVSCVAARAAAGVGVVRRPSPVEGVARVVTAPRWDAGRVVAELSLDGRRYRTDAVGDAAAVVGAAQVGETLDVEGRTARLDGPWEWMASRHLAGGLRVDEARPRSNGSWWWRASNVVHRVLRDGSERMAFDDRALFLGVVVGDDRDQSTVQRHRFRVSGLAHLTAVSGQNVGFALVVASPVLSRLGLRARWVATGAVLAWFALVTRLEPSVLRAVAMAAVAATVAWRGRYASGLRIVAVAVIALLLVDPLLVWSMGFRLSASASVALVVMARPIAGRLRGPRWWREAMGASLAAMAGTAPWLVVMAGSVPVAGPLWNLAAVPVAGWLMVWGLVAVPAGVVLGGPAETIAVRGAEWMCRWVAAVAELGAQPRWPHVGPIGVVVVCGAVVALAAARLPAVARLPVARLPGEWRPRGSGALRPAVVGAALVAVTLFALDLWWVPRRPTTAAASGSTLIVDGDAAVLLLGPRPDDEAVLELLVSTRRFRVDVVVATGGGKLAGGAVWALRQTVDVGMVLAGERATVPDARALVLGTIAVGAIRVEVDERDGRWVVSHGFSPRPRARTVPARRSARRGSEQGVVPVTGDDDEIVEEAEGGEIRGPSADVDDRVAPSDGADHVGALRREGGVASPVEGVGRSRQARGSPAGAEVDQRLLVRDDHLVAREWSEEPAQRARVRLLDVPPRSGRFAQRAGEQGGAAEQQCADRGECRDASPRRPPGEAAPDLDGE